MSRFIVVAPGSSEAAALATDELARVLGVATVDALAGTTATDAALRPASALPAAVEAVRAVGDDALIAPAREASNRAFDHVAWNLNLAASTRAGVILAFDAEGASAELLAEEIAAARLRAEAAAASVVAVVLTGGAPAVEADVPVLTLPLGDDLKNELAPGSKVRIAASTFSIFAFEALRKELEKVSELEFIFTSPSFVTEKVSDKLRKERREFFIYGRQAESSLAGSEFEIRLRNKLTQRAIARECADWVRRKVTFRSNATGNPMQQFAVIDDRAAYTQLQGFTTADLGYERGNAVSSFVNRLDEAPMTEQYLHLFDQIWNNPQQVSDVTQAVHDHIASVYTENSPARIYFLILYNLFAEFLDYINEDVLPNDRTGYPETKVWQSLYNFQRDAATGIINKLETYNGCILADSVGLGKTF
ncbi:MAG: hypothetical protein ACFNUK_09255, partial [Schaalia sp.]